MILTHSALYIDGTWQSPTTSDAISVHSASTEEKIGSVPGSAPNDVDSAVAAAGRAFRTWSRLEPADRADALDRARTLLAEMEEAEQSARGVDSLHGVIRLAMPVLYGSRAVIPALATFLTRHPDLRVEIIMSDARQNLIADSVDVAIRLGMGPLDDSTFGSRRLALVERLVVAAPAYISAHGTPANPAELAGHACIVQHGLFGRESWRFTHNQAVTSVDVSAKLWINSAPGILAATVAGLGIALATRVMAAEELRTGQLTQLLKPYRLDPAEVHAIFPAGPKPSAKVRAIVDHLAEKLDLHR